MTPFAYTGFGTHAPYFFAVERPLAEAVMENAADDKQERDAGQGRRARHDERACFGEM